MTAFNPITAMKAADQTAGAGSASQAAANGIQPKKITTQDFMTLLTAQLQNQDPTNPVDPTQFVTQLAQFTTLDQVSQIDSLLQIIAQGMLGASTSQTAAGTGANSQNPTGTNPGASS